MEQNNSSAYTHNNKNDSVVASLFSLKLHPFSEPKLWERERIMQWVTSAQAQVHVQDASTTPTMMTTSPQPSYHQPTSVEEVRTLWIGDLQYWVDENYLHNCFAHTGEVLSLSLYIYICMYVCVCEFVYLCVICVWSLVIVFKFRDPMEVWKWKFRFWVACYHLCRFPDVGFFGFLFF